jgi:hypothetical protein
MISPRVFMNALPALLRMEKKAQKEEQQLSLFDYGKEQAKGDEARQPAEEVKVIVPLAYRGESLFPDEHIPPTKPKLLRMPASSKAYDAYYILGDRIFAARPIAGDKDTILEMGIFEINDGQEVPAVSGRLRTPNSIEAGLYRKWLLHDGGASANAVLSYSLAGDYQTTMRNHGFATRVAELLLEKGGEAGVRRVFAAVPLDEDTKVMDDEKKASHHILTKLGFSDLGRTKWESYHDTHVYMMRDLTGR